MALRRERSNSAAAELPLRGKAETQPSEPPQSLQHERETPEAELARAAAKPSARSRILEARTSTLKAEGLKGFRNVVSEVDGLGRRIGEGGANGARHARFLCPQFAAAIAAGRRFFAAASATARPDRAALRRRGMAGRRGRRCSQLREPSNRLMIWTRRSRRRRRGRHARFRRSREKKREEEYEEPPPPRSYRGWAKDRAAC